MPLHPSPCLGWNWECFIHKTTLAGDTDLLGGHTLLSGCSVGCDASDDDDQPWMAASIDWPWSQMLKPLPGMVQWSVSSLLFAISMIYDCHTLGSHHTLGSLRHLHDCMHPCHITHIRPQCSSSGLEWSNGQYHHCSLPSP